MLYFVFCCFETVSLNRKILRTTENQQYNNLTYKSVGEVIHVNV